MKKLLPQLKILKIEQENSWIVSVQSRYYAITEETAVFLDMLQKRTSDSVAEFAVAMSKKLGYAISSADMTDAIAELPQEFFEVSAREETVKFNLVLMHGTSLLSLVKRLNWLYSRNLALLLAPLAVLACVWSIAVTPVVDNIPLLTAALVSLSIIFHELGHATACWHIGAKPGEIGIGLKGIIPTFYTDVSDAWTGDQRSRMIVDAGGVYFQLLFSGALALSALAFPPVIMALKLILLLTLFSSLPYHRFDGYWFAGDFLRCDNFAVWLTDTRRELLEKYRSRTLASNDLFNGIFISVHFAGFLVLHIWLVYAIWQLFAATFSDSAWVHWLSNTYQEHDSYLVAPITVLLLYLASRVIILRDGARVLTCLGLLAGLHASTPILHLLPRHRRYLSAVGRGLKSTGLPFVNVDLISKRALIAKYHELLWFGLLGRVHTGFGKWLVGKSHQVKSAINFDHLIDMPGPIVLLAPHYGSFISGALLLLMEFEHKRPLHIFYADPKTDPANAGYVDFYSRYFPDTSILYDNKRGVIAAAKALQRGEVVVIMPDVFAGKDLVDIPLLNRTIGVRQGVAYFEKKFNAKIIPIVSNFSGLSEVFINIFEPVETPEDKDLPHYHAEAMAAIFRALEPSFVSRPEHWHCWERFEKYSRPAAIPRENT